MAEDAIPTILDRPNLEVRIPNVFRSILDQAAHEVKNFTGGRISKFLNNWMKLTSDENILQTVAGYKIKFDDPPLQKVKAKTIKFSEKEESVIDDEIVKLANKGIIQECKRESGDYVSNIFLRPKSDGSYRMILNLSNLNKHIKYEHFKMDSLKTALNMISKDCYMSSVDIKDAYYSVPIHDYFQKFLKFEWRGKFYKFKVFANGLAPCPREFTKLLKPVISELRVNGIELVIYIDDILTTGKSKEECIKNVLEICNFLTNLGFVVHPVKSNLEPQKSITFLGFVIDSEKMTVTLTDDKKDKIKLLCKNLLHKKGVKIQQLAEVVGNLVAALPAVTFGKLYYRQLDNDKIKALKVSGDNYEDFIKLSDTAINDLSWWVHNLEKSYANISHGKPDITIFTDSSKSGYGFHRVENNLKGSGLWSSHESRMHINILEIKAIWFALNALVRDCKGKHIRIMIDNKTALAYVREMGGSKSSTCNAFARKIWQWAETNENWISVAYVPSSENVVADKESRRRNLNTEWRLHAHYFNKILLSFKGKFKPEIDLFASRLNYQLPKYVAWYPDPFAFAIDAFTLDLSKIKFFAFPPFSIISDMLRKIKEDGGTGIVLVPNWPTQPWYPMLLKMLIDVPRILGPKSNLLSQPAEKNMLHPLRKKLSLLACLVSGESGIKKVFPGEQYSSWKTHGEREHQNSIVVRSGSGKPIAKNWVLTNSIRL